MSKTIQKGGIVGDFFFVAFATLFNFRTGSFGIIFEKSGWKTFLCFLRKRIERAQTWQTWQGLSFLNHVWP